MSLSSSGERRAGYNGILLRRLLHNQDLCQLRKETAGESWPGGDFYFTDSKDSVVVVFLDSAHTRLLFLFLAHMAGGWRLREELHRVLERVSPTENFPLISQDPKETPDRSELYCRVIPDPAPPSEDQTLQLFPPGSPVTIPEERAVNMFFVSLEMRTCGNLLFSTVQKITSHACDILRNHIPCLVPLMNTADISVLDEEGHCFTNLNHDEAGLVSNPMQCLLYGRKYIQVDEVDMIGPEARGSRATRKTPIMLRFPRVIVTHEELVALTQELVCRCEDDGELREQTGSFFEMIQLQDLHVKRDHKSFAHSSWDPWELLAVLDPMDGEKGECKIWSSDLRRNYKAPILQGIRLVINHFLRLGPLPGEPVEAAMSDRAVVGLRELLQVENLDRGEGEDTYSVPESPESLSFSETFSCSSFSGASSSANTETRLRIQESQQKAHEHTVSFYSSLFRHFMQDLLFFGHSPWTFGGCSIVLENCSMAHITSELHHRVCSYWSNRGSSHYPSLAFPPTHLPMSFFTEDAPRGGMALEVLDPITCEFLGKEEQQTFVRSVRSSSKNEVFLDLYTEGTNLCTSLMEDLVKQSGLFPQVRFSQMLAVFDRRDIFPENGGIPPWVCRVDPGDSGLSADQLFYAKELVAMAPKRYVVRLCGPNSGKCVGHLLPSNPRIPGRKQQGALLDDHQTGTMYHPEHHVTLVFKPREKSRPTAEANQRILQEAAHATASVASSSRALSEERNRYIRSVVMSVVCPLNRKERRLHLFGESAFMGLFGQRWSDLVELQRTFDALERERRKSCVEQLRERFGPNFQPTGLATGSLRGIMSRMNTVSHRSEEDEDVLQEDELLGTDLGEMAHFQAGLQRRREEARNREGLGGRGTGPVRISIEDILVGPSAEQMAILEQSADTIAKLPEEWAPPDLAYYKKLFTRTLQKYKRPGQEAGANAPWSLPLLELVIENGLTLHPANASHARARPHPQFDEEGPGGSSGASASGPRRPQRPARMPPSSSVGMTLEDFMDAI